ncbi:MAG: LuxR C-terminal-related transcriptional regulator [Nitrospinales bacterium]
MKAEFREAGLTHREIEITDLVRKGFDDKEIAGYLAIEHITARNHVKSIYKKLGVHSRAKLVAFLNHQDVTR